MTAMRELKAVSIVEALEEELARRILDGDLTPGEHLREIELSEQYQVGRHTLRAAFDGLVRRGLLQRARNRGVFVRQFTEQDLAEIYELRTALEAQAFRTLAARKTVPETAREAMRRYRTLNSRSPRRLVVEADLAFHRAIVVATGNARLARVHEHLQAEIELCLSQLAQSYATVRELVAQHADLLKAIESGRPDKAEAAIRNHLENATAWLIEHVGTTNAATTASSP
jgi:DNA-binding GntR family transcriptional regulator